VTNELAFGPFLSLDETSLEDLLAGSRRATFSTGQELLREGESGDSAIAVVAGRVRVTQGDPPIVMATPTAPVLVGETALLTGFARNATVTALTPVRAYRIPASLLRATMSANPEFVKELASFAAIRAGNNFLRRSSPFADLPAAAIEALAAKLEPVAFAAGDIVLREGERGDDAYLVRGGELEITRTDRRLATVGPGAFVGEVSALTRMPRSATVRALTDVSAFRLRGDDVRPIVKKHQDLVSRLEGTMQSRHVPRRACEVVVAPAPDDQTAFLVREAGGSTYLRMAKDAHAIYEDIDGERSLRDLAMRHFERTGALDPAGVFATIATLQAAGLVTAPRVASDEPNARLLRVMDIILAPRIEIHDADRVARVLHRLVGAAFSDVGAWVALTLGVVGLAALVTVFRQSSPGDFGLGGLAVAFGGLLLAGIGHEAAHAVATKAEGRRIGKAGIGLFWFTPVVWVDTSDAWLLPARRRIRVNAAGPLFNFAFAGLCALLAIVLTGRAQDLVIWLAITNLVSVAFNLSPLLEFDGYYVLEDLTNVNALRRKSFQFAFGELAARPRRPATAHERGFLAYAVAAVGYVAVMSLIVLAGVPAVVNGTLGGRLSPELIPVVGVGLALALMTLQITPLVTEVRAARAAAAD
jgi:CRP-like cAMP-binding protein/Zn-dependent protease